MQPCSERNQGRYVVTVAADQLDALLEDAIDEGIEAQSYRARPEAQI